MQAPEGFRTRNWNGVLVISAPREVDVDNSPALRRSLWVAAHCASTVVVDLSSTTFFDVTALGVLATMSRELGAAGGEVRVVGANPQTRRCMRITGDDRLYRIFDRLPEALSTSASGAGDSPRWRESICRRAGRVRARRQMTIGDAYLRALRKAPQASGVKASNCPPRSVESRTRTPFRAPTSTQVPPPVPL